VVLSWAMLSACFVPLIILLLWRQTLTQAHALVMMFLGVATILCWHWFAPQLIENAADLYQGLPALIVALIFYGLVRLWCRYRQGSLAI